MGASRILKPSTSLTLLAMEYAFVGASRTVHRLNWTA